ncbi:MAG: hypothetical protein DRJ44_02520 [Thermoprotei archaeon]|nr:MAG: hypothetical protein DRJ44_02520 [Thermoprotei archaeon]
MKLRLNEIIISFFAKSIHRINSGNVVLTINGVVFAKTSFAERSITVNLFETTPIKELRELVKLPLSVKEILSTFSKFKNLAEILKRNRASIIVKWKDKELFIIGEKAKPKLKHLLRTDAIEIKNIKDLLFLLKEIA